MASDRGHHERDGDIPRQSAEDLRLNLEQRVVEPLLIRGERHGYGFRLADGECPDIAPPRSVDHARERMQCLDVRDESNPFFRGDAISGELVVDLRLAWPP